MPPVSSSQPLERLGDDINAAPVAAGPGNPLASEGQPAAGPGGSGRRDRARGEIWPGCSVKPLGINGGSYFYLDVHSQMRPVVRHDAQTIMALFGNKISTLCWQFPKWIRQGEDTVRKPDHFDHQTATVAMIRACSEQGLFDPESAVRGVGAWSDDDGHLIYHMGDKMLVAGVERLPDTYQNRIYPAFPPIPHPAGARKSGVAIDAVGPLLETLASWNWARPDIDPIIALGTFGVQAFGGALDWRPAFWFTGGAGSGKSALQRLMLHLHGGESGLVQSTDPTARGIASQLGNSSLPVALDELEPGDAGSGKERDIIVTARVAASGGRWLRGSSDQKGASGQLRSTFLFSSILVPGLLKSQDLQRIILLNLDRLPEGSRPPDLRAETWRRRGAVIKRQIIERWPTWATRLDLWREAFAFKGITGRDADNWATTLAMAQMIQAKALPMADEMTGSVERVFRHITATLGDAGNDADEVLVYLLSQSFDPFRRGQQYTIAQWIQVAGALDDAPEALRTSLASGTETGSVCEIAAKAANALLAPLMLRVIREPGEDPRLFVGNKPVRGLSDLFRHSQWAGGAWRQSLARLKGAQPSSGPRTMAGISARGIEVPLASMPGLMVLPAERAGGQDGLADAQMNDFY